MKTFLSTTLLITGFLVLPPPPASADLKAGDDAKLFKSVDENLQPVDMADLVKGKPLVLVVGSCS